MMGLNYKISYNSIAFFLVIIILLSYLLEGVSVALMHYLGIFLNSSPLTILRYILLPLTIIVVCKSNRIVFDLKFKFLLLIFCLGLFLKFIIQINNPAVEIKSLLNYISPIFMASLMLSLDKSQTEKVFNILIIATFIFSIIALAQAFFSDVLPESFMEPPQLDKTNLKSVDLVYDFIKMKRPNGLIGNAIEFGFLMNTAIFITLLKKRDNIKTLTLVLIFVTTSIILTLSRAAILQSLVLFFTYFIIYLNFKTKIKLGLMITIVLSIAVIYIDTFADLIYNYIQFTYDRIFFSDSSGEASNYEHQKDYIMTWEAIKENFIIGVPLGTNKGSETLITDGSWFHFILEYGTVLFTVFLLMIFRLIKIFISKSKEKVFIIIYFMLLVIVGFLNSAIISKVNYFIFFMIVFSLTKLHINVKTN